ncbi:uncharacterized protein LOC120340142 isoform X1 [Styela clava]
MGADISKEDADDFKQKYREKYGVDISDADLLEEYRMAKLKADRRQREQSLGNEDRRRDEYSVRSTDLKQAKEDSYARKKQDDNLRIMKTTYESRKGENRHRHDRSQRSSRHRDERRRDRDRRSSRHRENSRHSSSDSSTKENKRKSHHSSKYSRSFEKSYERSSKKTRSVDDMNVNSQNRSRDERHSSKYRDRSRNSRSESSDVEIQRKSTRKPPTENPKKKSSRKSGSGDKHQRSQKSSRKSAVVSRTDDEGMHSKKDDKKYDAEQSEVKMGKKRKKKKVKASHHQSAPDLLDVDRQYGRGPWQRTHGYFDQYGQRPQSWVQEISQGQSSTLPAPVMERQIIYGMPATLPRAVDGLGYPLKERSPGFQPVPYQTYLMHKPQRPQSMDLSYTHHDFSSLPPSTAVQSPNTSIKLPAGAVPAVGPRGPLTSPIVNSPPIIPARGYEVQAHLPSNGSSTLPAKFRQSSSGGTSNPPTYKTPPQYGNSVSVRSDGPTPKPRTKTPVKEHKRSSKEKGSRKSKSSKHGVENKQHKPKITAISAREDFESLLAADYDMTHMKTSEDFNGEFPPVFPGNYRANDTIFVDDVIFREQPRIKSYSDTDSSDMMTDEEINEIKIGEEFSPNSIGYSSGFDLEIPEGFCFDSEGAETSSVKHKNKGGKQKSAGVRAQKKKVFSGDNKTKTSKKTSTTKDTQPKSRLSPLKQKDQLILTTIGPVSRTRQQSTSPDRKQKSSPKMKSTVGKNKPRVSSNEVEKVMQPVHSAMQQSSKSMTSNKTIKKKNRKIQAPSEDNSYQRIIYPSHHWHTRPELERKKKMHDIGVGTKTSVKQKSIAIQTPKPKSPAAQPIYFLKPLSAQEVFIDDSSIASHSETDMSTVHTAATSSVTSTGSVTARSGTSWSRSSTYSSNPDHTDPSEVESVAQKFERNSKFYASKPNEQPSIASSVDFEPEPSNSSSIGPPSMTLGVSESIQASSYTGKGGKVFYFTRSRHGSSPATSIRDSSQPIISPSEPQIQQEARLKSESQVSESQYFNPLEVGQWVLNYVQEHKLAAQKKNQPSTKEEPTDQRPQTVPPQIEHAPLRKQEAFDAENKNSYTSQKSSVHIEQPPVPTQQPKIVPLTTEALSKHEDNNTWTGHDVEDSGTELSTNISSDLGPFQRELIKTRHKIRKHNQRDKSPELTHTAEEYKAHLKRWNDSPSTNVVLAEVCAVTDDDIEDARPKSDKPFSKYSNEPVIPTYGSRNTTVVGSHNQIHESDSDSETTLSTNSSEDHQNPQERLRESLQRNRPSQPGLNHNYSNVQSMHSEKPNQSGIKPNERDLQNAGNLEKIENFLDNLDKNNASNFQNRPSTVSPPTPDEDWRIIGAPMYPPTQKQNSVHHNNNTSQMDPTVPRPHMRKSSEETIDIPEMNIKDPHLRLRSTSLTNQSETGSCSSLVANPFNKMDNEEIESLVEKIPNRGSMGNIDSEKDVIAQLEKSRQSTKRESLEERTARILGIHRKTSTDESDDGTPTNARSAQENKKDINAYMNNLLTGAADVSPATRQKYFASGMADKTPIPVKSPLAANSSKKFPSHENFEANKNGENLSHLESKQSVEHKESSDDDDDMTLTESFSINVSDSVMEASVDCKVRLEKKVPSSQPTEYKIPDYVDGRSSGPVSPSRGMMSPSQGMMLSYGANIYAETPGFHKQDSFDSTDSDEPDFIPSMPVSSEYKQNFTRSESTDYRMQDSPVPISVNSPPLTEKEMDIVRELVSSKTNSVVGSAGDMSPVANDDAIHQSRSLSLPSSPRSNRSWSPSRELARDKIAKSIGFTLPNQKSDPQDGTTESLHSSGVINSEEYDIKILSRDRNKNDNMMVLGNTQHPNKDVANALQSIGLKPEESWVMSV